MKEYTYKEVADKIKEIMNADGRTSEVCVGVKCEYCTIRHMLGRCPSSTFITLTDNDFDVIMNYEAPVDWSKVPVDTKILVKCNIDDEWQPRHFAGKVKNDGSVNAWCEGGTSFTCKDDEYIPWTYAKLYKEEANVMNK